MNGGFRKKLTSIDAEQKTINGDETRCAVTYR